MQHDSFPWHCVPSLRFPSIPDSQLAVAAVVVVNAAQGTAQDARLGHAPAVLVVALVLVTVLQLHW